MVTSDDRTPRRAVFGRRKGRRLKPRHALLLETLLPPLAVPLGAPPPRDLADLFLVPVDGVQLEIGFGGGEHLAGEARAAPHIGFIGCEPFVNGMAKMLSLVDQHGLANVRLHLGDAAELLAWLPAGSLARVDLLYPDPWPKRRHWKRRFIQDATVGAMARVLRVGGEARCATDIADYAAWALDHFLHSPAFAWTAERAEDWRQPWLGHVATRYETKTRREGRVPCYLTFRRR